METVRLTRTGDRDLEFVGDLIVEASSRSQGGYSQNRWWELKLYRTADGQFVCASTYRTQWDGEREHSEAEWCATHDAVTDWFRYLDPSTHVKGYPPGLQYDKKQAQLEQTLRADLAAAVTTILKALPPESL